MRVAALKRSVLIVVGVEPDVEDRRPRGAYTQTVCWIVGRDLHVLRRSGPGEAHRDQESEDEMPYRELHAPLLIEDGTAELKHGGNSRLRESERSALRQGVLQPVGGKTTG